jgi:hypothetical protein
MFESGGTRLCPAFAGGAQGKLDITERREPWQERIALKDHAAIEPRTSHGKTIDQNASGGRGLQSGNDHQQSRFPAAGGADQGDELVLLNLQAHTGQGSDIGAGATIGFGDIPDDHLGGSHQRTCR